MLGSSLLTHGFDDDSEMAALLPAPLTDYSAEFVRSSRGLRLLEGLEAASPAPYFSGVNPTPEFYCAFIAARALAAGR